MKKIQIILIMLAVVLIAHSQNMVVESFRLLPNDLTANIEGTQRFDPNTRKNAALIKVVTTEKDFYFDGGMMGLVGDPIQKVGEIWVYVPEGSKQITIQHQNLGILRNYHYSEAIRSGKTYEMVLSTGKIVTHIEQDLGGNYVVLKVNPANSVVTIDNEIKNLDENGELAEFIKGYGRHEYKISSNLHEPEMGTFEVVRDKKTNLNINLRPAYTILKINTTPNGASVNIDDEYAGETPLTSKRLSRGDHQISYSKPQYKSKIVNVTLAGTGNTESINEQLIPNFATVTITVPNGAEIYVNNDKKGEGRWTGTLNAGDYVIEARKASHHSVTTTISVTAGEQIIKQLDAPTPRYGTININSTPHNATIQVDGKEMGTTPNILKDILIGTRNITIKRDGYSVWQGEVIVTEGEVAQLSATLQKMSAPVPTIAQTPTTSVKQSGASKGTHNGHEYVDLGLSVKWATCNVGATSPEDYGDYYAWGETATKNLYDWSTYKYCRGTGTSMTKYCRDSEVGKVDNKTTLELSDDVAYTKWGGNWRIPTDSEYKELIDNCTWKWTTQNGVKGYKITSKKNGNSIFLPAAGKKYTSSTLYAGNEGVYWSSSLDRSGDGAYDMEFGSEKVNQSCMYRYDGTPIRAVYTGATTENERVVSISYNEPSYSSSQTSTSNNGHEYVDLGLSVKWATCNVGATSPEDYGDYYAWGETATKSLYDWSTYKYCKGRAKSTTKYKQYRSHTLDMGDDVAYTKWGENWRMPTESEYKELIDNCMWKWTTQNGVKGYKITSKKNGNSIFLPAAGKKYSSSTLYVGEEGEYWSSSNTTEDGASYLSAKSDGVRTGSMYRYGGTPIRAVYTGATTQNERVVSISYNEPSYSSSQTSNLNNGHEYVDLGLSVKWATCNVGANSPEDYGNYFAWGETKPKRTYSWSTYKYCNGDSKSMTKYCTQRKFGKVDNKTTLEKIDDTARVNWGGSWRMPTESELDELKDNCIFTKTTQNGVDGCLLTSMKNGNSIFLPFAGYCDYSGEKEVGVDCRYMSSTVNTDLDYNGYGLLLTVSGDELLNYPYNSRCEGGSIRPVCD